MRKISHNEKIETSPEEEARFWKIMTKNEVARLTSYYGILESEYHPQENSLPIPELVESFYKNPLWRLCWKLIHRLYDRDHKHYRNWGGLGYIFPEDWIIHHPKSSDLTAFTSNILYLVFTGKLSWPIELKNLEIYRPFLVKRKDFPKELGEKIISLPRNDLKLVENDAKDDIFDQNSPWKDQ